MADMAVCFLCNKKENLKLFCDKTFQRCCAAIQIRESRGIKYGDLSLSAENRSEYGFHNECYKKVTALKRQYNEGPNKASEAAEGPSTSTIEVSKKQAEVDMPEDITMNGKSIRDKPTTSQIVLLEKPTELVDTDDDITGANSMSDTFGDLKDKPPTSNIEQYENQLREGLQQGDTGKLCVFCDQYSKRVGSHRQFVIESTVDCVKVIKTIAIELEDNDLYEKIENNERIYHHRSCLVSNRNRLEKARVITGNEQSDWYAKRNVHIEAFKALKVYIKQEIIDGEKIIYLNDLLMRYKAILYEIDGERYYGQSKLSFENYTSQHLQVKILKTFEDSIVIEKSQGGLMTKIVRKKDINVERLINKTVSEEQEIEETVRNVAFEVRNSVRMTKKKKLPALLRTEDIIEGECDVSELLYILISSLVQGPDVRKQMTDDTKTKIYSVCHDLIYIIHNGQIKPAKHLKLGLTMKSLTNSRKVLSILNKLGHSISYPVAEGLETELTYTAIERNQLIPSGICVESGHSTHLAFDNYDRFVETRTGKDTLHDTVGIIYQFPCGNVTPQGGQGQVSEQCEKGRRRQRFEHLPQSIEPYLKKPKALTALSPLEEVISLDTSDVENVATIKDMLWIFSMIRISNETPMWIGYNSNLFKDYSELQIIDYLPQINLSPTNYTVVNETLNVAEKIRNQCEQENIIVTYDLAIAKMAQQIKIAESPKYDRIFINFGAFHIEMAFFKALGKFIDCCGLDNILTECGILAPGSLNGFLSGTHFNRCKRIHPLLFASLHCLHFERFISETCLDVTQIDSLLMEVAKAKIADTESPVIPRLLEYFIEEYEKYKIKTLEGGHGKTAQFYMLYMEFVSDFLKMSRAVRTRQLDLYMAALHRITDLFFTFNHQNYARWSVKHHSDLLTMKKEAPELVEEFKRGAFGIKRKENNFSRSPIDLVLEQSINANAGSKLTGLIHMTNSIGARQRWALSHSIRTRIVNELIEDLNLEGNRSDIASDLRKRNIDTNYKAFQELVTCMKQNLDPFNSELEKQNLFNISTGRAAKDETTAFLLNARRTGAEQKNKFIDECNKDENRFEKPLKRNKILNFASECAKKTQVDKLSSTVAQVKMERDIFGRLLTIALQKKIDMDEVLSYPLSPLPPALAQYNGDMCKTNKAKLGNLLKSKVQLVAPPDEDILLIDGFYLLRRLGPIPLTFQEISEMILRKICKTEAKSIHLVFDRYVEPSIKDIEREQRATENTPYLIKGPTQKRPQDFGKSLNNIKFKEALIKFLIIDWERDDLTSIIGTKKIFLTMGNYCYSFKNHQNKIDKKEETEYYCLHEEADTRLIFHLSKAQPGSKALMYCSDTDILIILLGNMEHLANCSQIWIYDTQRQLACNCTELANQLGSTMCRALPALHAFTGCDYTSAFKGKGKIKAYNMLEKNIAMQNMFASLNGPEDLNNEEKINQFQQFTCKLYSSSSTDVNQARNQIFTKKYGSITEKKKFLKKVTGFNASILPPCWKSLKQHMLRSLLVTSMWRSATLECNAYNNPTNCGWVLTENNKYHIMWYEGDPTPLSVEDIIIESDSDMSLDSSDEEDQ